MGRGITREPSGSKPEERTDLKDQERSGRGSGNALSCLQPSSPVGASPLPANSADHNNPTFLLRVDSGKRSLKFLSE